MGEEVTEGDRGQQFRGLLSKPASHILLNLAYEDHRECFRAEFSTAAQLATLQAAFEDMQAARVVQ